MVFGQCDFDWKPGEGLPGVNGSVYAVTTWDPDGAGPQPELLVVGGDFTVAGDVLARNIAAWDGISWQALGSGMGGSVRALTVYNGELIAGGWFTTAGNHIARWYGSSWQALGNGLNDDVLALTVYNGELIAGGVFTTAGGVDANNIARWDGSSWKALGSGLNDDVLALTVYNGELIAGGWFTTASGVTANYIARWNSSSWQALGSGMNRGVEAMTVYNGELIAGGSFTRAGGVIANRIAQWDGSSWQALGSGMNNGVYALTVYNGELIVGGWLTLAAWNGSSWRALGSGMNGWVYALTVYNGELIAGGGFLTAGGVTANYIARWNGSSWQALGVGGGMSYGVFAMTVYNGELIAGGEFLTAGGVSANRIARWDGSSWQALGSGMNNGVYALTVYNGELIVGGWLTLAAWNGSSWRALGLGNNGVYALTVYNGELIAGGDFTTAGGVAASGIARWDGSSWQALGSGMGGIPFELPYVSALTVYNGELIAGGFFYTAGGVAANCIARWNGSSWQALGSGMIGGYVSALMVYNGELIAGGGFLRAGGVAASGIASWDGSSWQALGGGMSGGYYYEDVSALMVYNGELIAGGDFTTAGGVTASYIARWDGSSWKTLGSGMGGSNDYSRVLALAVYKGELIAGGNFITAGSVVSACWARWGLPEVLQGDLNHDCIVDINDLANLVDRWLDSDCLYNGWCYETDLNYDLTVNFGDFAFLAINWLEGNGSVDVNENVYRIEVWYDAAHDNPLDINQVEYGFDIEVATDGNVARVEFLTPEGKTFSIPNTPGTWDDVNQIWTCRYFDEEYGCWEWEFEKSGNNINLFDDFGDGTYTLKVFYADNSYGQTQIVFVDPCTGQPLSMPTQIPRIISPAYQATVELPITVIWEQCIDPNVNGIWVELCKDEFGTHTEVGSPFDKNQTRWESVDLSNGIWYESIDFDNRYTTVNSDGIEVELGKDRNSEQSFTIETLP